MTPYQRATVKLVNSAFSRLDCLNNKSWTHHREKVFKMAVAEEKRYRSGGFDKYHSDALSVANIARSFVVKRIAEFLRGDRMPSGKDFLHFQPSALYCAGLVDEYRADILKAWSGLDYLALASIDYAQLVSPSNP